MEGRLLLDRFFVTTGTSPGAFAARIGVTRTSVYLWRHRAGQVPSLANAIAIERETKGAVPASAWTGKPARRLVRRSVRRPLRQAPENR